MQINLRKQTECVNNESASLLMQYFWLFPKFNFFNQEAMSKTKRYKKWQNLSLCVLKNDFTGMETNIKCNLNFLFAVSKNMKALRFY